MQPHARPVGERVWELDKAYVYEGIRIPRGFRWDGASIPRFAWSIIGLTPGGLMEGPSLVHDYLYRYGGKLPRFCQKRKWTRKEADGLFLRMMAHVGVKRPRRKLAHMAVRLFGGRFWGKEPPDF